MNELKELKECTYTQSSTQVCSVYICIWQLQKSRISLKMEHVEIKPMALKVNKSESTNWKRTAIN